MASVIRKVRRKMAKAKGMNWAHDVRMPARKALSERRAAARAAKRAVAK